MQVSIKIFNLASSSKFQDKKEATLALLLRGNSENSYLVQNICNWRYFAQNGCQISAKYNH